MRRELQVAVAFARVVLRDDSVASDGAAPLGVPARFDFIPDQAERKLSILSRPGTIGIDLDDRRSALRPYRDHADPTPAFTPELVSADPLRPFAPTPWPMNGLLSDPWGAWHPRRIELALARGETRELAVFPAPMRVDQAGGAIVGNLRFADGVPAAWAVIEVNVRITAVRVERLRAQADARGEFAIALRRLPPLADGLDDYSARLTVRARRPPPVDPARPLPAPAVDPDTLPSCNLTPVDAATPVAEIQLGLRPGRRHHPASNGTPSTDRHLIIHPL